MKMKEGIQGKPDKRKFTNKQENFELCDLGQQNVCGHLLQTDHFPCQLLHNFFPELKNLESKKWIRSIPQSIRNCPSVSLCSFTEAVNEAGGFSVGRSPEVHTRSWHQLQTFPLGGGNEISKFRSAGSRAQTTTIHSFLCSFSHSVSPSVHTSLAYVHWKSTVTVVRGWMEQF